MKNGPRSRLRRGGGRVVIGRGMGNGGAHNQSVAQLRLLSSACAVEKNYYMVSALT
jgi:hypothetical protein